MDSMNFGKKSKKMCRRSRDKDGEVHLRDKKGRFCKKNSKRVKIVPASKLRKSRSRSRSRK